jgi:hypothetical protein
VYLSAVHPHVGSATPTGIIYWQSTPRCVQRATPDAATYRNNTALSITYRSVKQNIINYLKEGRNKKRFGYDSWCLVSCSTYYKQALLLSIIHWVVCLLTGTQTLLSPEKCELVPSLANSFTFSLKRSGHPAAAYALFVFSSLPSIVPSITCSRRQFLHNAWQSAYTSLASLYVGCSFFIDSM